MSLNVPSLSIYKNSFSNLKLLKSLTTKGKGICLESRYPRYTCSSDFTFPLAVGAYGSLQLSIQPWICAPGTHYGWMDQGSVEYEVCSTLLHMASTGNRTPDFLILSPTPYPLGHMLLSQHLHN